MNVGIPIELEPGEHRVALVPTGVPALMKLGLQVLVEPGAGRRAGFPDREYVERGAQLVAARADLLGKADILLEVRTPGAAPATGTAEIAGYRIGQLLVGFADPLTAHDTTRALARQGVSIIALELVPRITRAQSMDALSSMGTVAGYKAVLIAAARLSRMFPMMMTAAGTITPARVLIIGAGVSGLQAIATARRLGAKVEAYDVRPTVKEQIESLGARFVELPLETGSAEDKGGYATAQDESFYRRQRELLARIVAASDVVITTAAIPGRKAPILVTSDMVHAMAPGSVVLDLAAERGGNCELTRPDQEVVVGDVTILGPTNIAATVPYHASQMLSKNFVSLLQSIVKDGRLTLDVNDEVVRETLITHGGEVVNARVRQLMGLQPLASAAAGGR